MRGCGESVPVNDSIFELRGYNKGNIVGGGPLIPLLVASCANCGHTIFFNAIALGLIDPQTGDFKP